MNATCSRCGGVIELTSDEARLGALKGAKFQHELCPGEAPATAGYRRFQVELSVREVMPDRLDSGVTAEKAMAVILPLVRQQVGAAPEELSLSIVSALAQQHLLIRSDEEPLARFRNEQLAPNFEEAVSGLTDSVSQSWARVQQSASIIDAEAGRAV